MRSMGTGKRETEIHRGRKTEKKRKTDKERERERQTDRLDYLFASLVMRSMGTGKMIVEFFSAEMEFNVWNKKS